jgi:hypothetical protein
MNEGKKDRRDPIRTIKTKNPVAKAHQTVGTGSGAHKDKKRAMKQGEVKHKNQEYAESLQDRLNAVLAEDAVKDLQTELADKYRELAPGIEKYKDSFKAGQLYDALEAIADQHGAHRQFTSMMAGARNRAHMEYDTNPGGFQNWFWFLPFADDQNEGMAEEFNAEYDDEAGMADNNLETLKRAVDGIDDVINTGDNLPEWCQEKIAVAKSMLVTVWDYMLSDKDGETAVSEASALEKFRKAASEREKKHDDAEKEMNARHARGEEDMKGSIDRLEKHVNTKEGLRDPKDNPCWKGYYPVGTKKKNGRTVPNCVPKAKK